MKFKVSKRTTEMKCLHCGKVDEFSEEVICKDCLEKHFGKKTAQKIFAELFEISEIHTEEYFGRQCVLIPKEDLQKLKQNGVSK
jgi:hypothetical protein